MWIFFAIGSLFFQALEVTIDKIATIQNRAIDSLSATFWRSFMFLSWFAIFGLLGVLGPLQIFLPLPIFLFAFLWMISSFLFTYLLKHIEVTGESALSYASPFFYLIIDVFIFKAHLAPLQIFGILLLTAGGLTFAIQPGKFRFKKEFTPRVWGIFLYNLILGGIEFYLFQYYLNTYSINEVTFYFNTWLIMSLGFMIIISLQRKWNTVIHTARENNFLGKTIVSKGLDAIYSYLFLHAIALATVSQVNAIGSLYPLIVMGVVYLMQNIFGFKADEKFSREHILFKLIAIILLCVGGFLAQ